ncbi:Cytochrome c oxidase subunit 7C, mitochondrial [Atta colombica]|uniref:Cytochrome c oxidase subunit 7C, mitochondrial n=1 Tax=Atta colombica TaxID=520822 RepID=A0A195BMG8_9HYME|nr:PREDICTED: cytochrome c oxidase subunit 7C, mitochondrial [Atta colombica]KYM86209.1 Cytochrome c oxidase subunit 7C, mitochondrial [Atta colombica]
MINSANSIAHQVRRFTTSAIRRSMHHNPYDGVPGYNMPFSLQNRHFLLLGFMVFLGIPFSLPLFMVRYQLKK